jgi:gamma-glutamyl:cysteine ligase YbdK (ATP-grasp superfamily)
MAKMIEQHEPLRVPAGWKDQDRGLVVQLERILDDIYRHFRKVKKADLDQDVIDILTGLQNSIDEIADDLSALEGTVDDVDDKADGIASELTALYTLTVAQLKAKGSA